MSIAKVVCLIACHGGPADHFATFAENLAQDGGYEVHAYAAGPALKKFQERKVVAIEFNAEDPAAAIQLAQKCSRAAVVLTDVGHPFDIQLQETFKIEAPEVLRIAYYDNPEPYVPGGYSAIAPKVMLAADLTFFSNANHATSPLYQEPHQELDLPFDHRYGLGYYPTSQAEGVVKRREQDQDKMRAQFFEDHSIEDREQKIIVYFGGNNEEYFTKAFPAFLNFLKEADFSNFVFIVQQHPGAKTHNRDGLQLEKYQGEIPIILSKWSSDNVQIPAYAAVYYQTSMCPLFALANIPAIQAGHEIYDDLLVRNNLCQTATTAAEFTFALSKLEEKVSAQVDPAIVLNALGIRDDWVERLKEALNTSS